MPRNVLPDAARVLPKAGQKIWLKAFNQALDEGQPESEASKIAWAAVERAGYTKQSNGKWSKSMDNEMVLNEDGTFYMSAPLMKVSISKRTVEGFATLDNMDEAKDVVDADASQEAFTDWFGNIREMHQKIAVGKAIDWKPGVYTDDNGQEYNGIWVTAKISKGAEDTWQKVLDGTLAGFSIGGATLEKERTLAKDSDGETHQVWRITKYKLTELSLVDNPCNRLATISLIKSVDGAPEVGDTVADGDIEKAYDGGTGDFVDLSSGYKGVVTALETLRDQAIQGNADGVVACVSNCLSDFRSKVRWESMDAEYNDQMVSMGKAEDTTSIETDKKEGKTMEKSDEVLQDSENSDKSSVDTLTDADKGLLRKLIDFIKGDETPTGASAETGDENKNEDGDEPEMNADEVAKAVTEAGEELAKGMDSKFEQVGESLKTIVAALEKVATGETLDELKKELVSQIEELAGRIEVVENSGAVKKSGEDAGEAGEKVEKSDGLWLGAILPEFAK